jgi:hypothetical protein
VTFLWRRPISLSQSRIIRQCIAFPSNFGIAYGIFSATNYFVSDVIHKAWVIWAPSAVLCSQTFKAPTTPPHLLSSTLTVLLILHHSIYYNKRTFRPSEQPQTNYFYSTFSCSFPCRLLSSFSCQPSWTNSSYPTYNVLPSIQHIAI